jgi:pimeloyl-ACP methyl ester carboxylesterase
LPHRLDIYGRGYSDAPDESNLPVYITQLALLLQHVSWQKTRIVGLSMGGAIAAALSTQFPKLVDEEIVLVASAGNFTVSQARSLTHTSFNVTFRVISLAA